MSKPEYPHVFVCTPLGDFYQRLELDNEMLEKYNKLDEKNCSIYQSAVHNGWMVFCADDYTGEDVSIVRYDLDKYTNKKIDECISEAYQKRFG